MKTRKSMRMVAQLSFMLVLLMNMTNIAIVHSAANSVGVEPGDWMIHDLLFEGVPPPIYADFIYREVLSVNDAWIMLNYTAYLSNGTIDTRIVEGDLFKGPEYIYPVLIPSNLGVGDEVYSEALEKLGVEEGKLIIKGERVADVRLGRGVANRTFRRTLIYTEFSYGVPPWPSANVTAEWDKTTGILVSMFSQQLRFNLTVILIETNAITENIGSPFIDYRLFVAIATISMLIIMVTYSLFRSQGKRRPKK